MENTGNSSSSDITGSKGRRSSNYTTAEDISIARAYIDVSTDAIVGSDQKVNLYYGRIYDAYKERKPKDAVFRTKSSVETRVKLMLKKCVRFAACFKRIKDLNKSGVCEDDEIPLATAVFNEIVVKHPREDVGPAFRFLAAWKELRGLPKFAAASIPWSNSASTNTEDDKKEDKKEKKEVKEERSSNKRERPDGRQKAKAEQAAQMLRAKRVKLAEVAVRLQQQHVDEIARRNEILLFSNGPGGAESDLAKRFFALKQAQALGNLEKEVEKTEANNASSLNVLGDVVFALDE